MSIPQSTPGPPGKPTFTIAIATCIFLQNQTGNRAVYGASEKFQHAPHWRDLILFYEYFHGDNGAGIGASHQTGWTGCIARIIQTAGSITKASVQQATVRR